MYLVQTLGVINDSVLVGISFILSSSVIWTSNKFQGRRCFWNVNCPINSLYHRYADSSFIHAFEELATEHYALYSSSSEFDSLLAAANTKNSFTLVPSSISTKRTDSQTFSCLVGFTGTPLSLESLVVVSDTILFQRTVFYIALRFCVVKLFWHCNRLTFFKKYTRRTVK